MNGPNRFAPGLGILLAAVLSVVATARGVAAAPVVQEKRVPTISFESTSIVVAGVTPRAQVILFGIEQDAGGYATRTSRVSLSTESDQRGVARFDLQRTIAARSIFAAVDGVTGGFAVVSPEGTPVSLRRTEELRMRSKVGLDFAAFDLDSHWIEAICIRPGQGAWRFSLMDGSTADDNPIRGTVQIGAGRMNAIGAAAVSPGRFQPHDILIAIDPYSMTVVATVVSE